MIYLPPRAQRMEKFLGLLKIDPLIKPQISLCALCELCGEISSGNCCQISSLHKSAAPAGTRYHIDPKPRPTCLGRKLPRTRTGLARFVP